MMMTFKMCRYILLLLFAEACFGMSVRDSTSHVNIKGAKHYFNSTIYLNNYSTSESDFRSNKRKPLDPLSERLGKYKFSQLNLGFYLPLITQDFHHHDSVTISNFSFLTTGNLLISTPHFVGIPDHNLYKISLGLRGIYNNGKKDIFFADVSPFLAQDNRSAEDAKIRFSSTLLWDHVFNENFSLRLGITRTYIFGNRFTLPYIGFRVGKLDAVNLSVQFPRNISVNFPLGRHFKGSVFIKPQGGLYSFANSDTLYSGPDATLEFGQWSLLNGMRVDYTPKRNFSVFFSAGITQFNHISFSSVSYNKDNRFLLSTFYDAPLKPTLFINFGLTFRFGKTKQAYNNRNMYEMLDLNNTVDPGDNNSGPGNGNIPEPGNGKDLQKLRYRDIEDLIETQDL